MRWVVVSLGKIQGLPAVPISVPTPNHSHIVDTGFLNSKAIWWEGRPVLVPDESDWPATDGSSGITSVDKDGCAEADGRAIEVGSNFFLSFRSRIASMAAMTHENRGNTNKEQRGF
jgi:hypothetical protein